MNNLNKINVQELSVQEMKKTDGGFVLIIAIAVVGLLVGFAAGHVFRKVK